MPPRPLVVSWSRGETMIYSLGTKRFLMVKSYFLISNIPPILCSRGLVVSWWDHELFSWYQEISHGLTMRPRDHEKGGGCWKMKNIMSAWEVSWYHETSRGQIIFSNLHPPSILWSRGLMVRPWAILLVPRDFSWSNHIFFIFINN